MIPLTILYCIFSILVTGAIFVLLYSKRGLKPAVGVSLLSLIILAVLFIFFMTFALNAMG